MAWGMMIVFSCKEVKKTTLHDTLSPIYDSYTLKEDALRGDPVVFFLLHFFFLECSAQLWSLWVTGGRNLYWH